MYIGASWIDFGKERIIKLPGLVNSKIPLKRAEWNVEAGL
jgi:hypothetical protein